MRVLYGVQGTGNGHITRARLMCKALRNAGIDVDVIMSGRVGERPDVPEFGDYKQYKGITFYHSNGKIDRLKTARELSLGQAWRDMGKLNLDRYEMLINDFEPLTAWAAKRHGLPSVSVSHQAAFTQNIPTREMGTFNRLLAHHYAPCQHALGVHWYHFQQEILPPIIEPMDEVTSDGSILVYLPFEDLQEVIFLLQRFSRYQFKCFHPAINNKEQSDNVLLHPIDRRGFLKALADCSGVFCNAGFELPSEAMAAGKKLLVKPLHGQFEQVTNAYTLQSLGLASVLQSLEPFPVDAWLQQDQVEPVIFPDVSAFLANRIKDGTWQDTALLSQQLWQQVSYPSATQLVINDIESGVEAESTALSKIRLTS